MIELKNKYGVKLDARGCFRLCLIILKQAPYGHITLPNDREGVFVVQLENHAQLCRKEAL